MFSFTGEVPQFSTRWCLNTNHANRHSGCNPTHAPIHTLFKLDSHRLSVTHSTLPETPIKHPCPFVHTRCQAHTNSCTHTDTDLCPQTQHSVLNLHTKQVKNMQGSPYRLFLCSYDIHQLPFHPSPLSSPSLSLSLSLPVLLIISQLHVPTDIISI